LVRINGDMASEWGDKSSAVRRQGQRHASVVQKSIDHPGLNVVRRKTGHTTAHKRHRGSRLNEDDLAGVIRDPDPAVANTVAHK